jgi:aminoglycoside phosphotransferase (APT) family kinase protein
MDARQIGTGQMARCFRYVLEVEGDERAPTSLVGKFNSTDPGTLDLAAEFGVYASEVGFYRDLAADLPIPTPGCHFAAIAADGRSFALILEDMRPASQGDQMHGCSVAVAREAVAGLASMHAVTWNQESLEDFGWLKCQLDSQEFFYEQQASLTPGFLERFAHRLEPEIVALAERMTDGYRNLLSGLLEEPSALIHWDYRADNLLIDEARRPPSVTAVDWQTVMLGPPLQDLAYFIGASLRTRNRREHEHALIEAYYDELSERGVTGYGFEQCRRGYQLGSFSGLSMAIRAAMLVVETERGNEMFTTMARRHGRQILDLGADDLL